MRLKTHGVFILICMLSLSPLSFAHQISDTVERLAEIGPAPDIDLIAQDGKRFSLRDARGKVVAVSFTFTRCADVCPMLTSNLVSVQRKLGDRFGADVYFVTISMDPATDNPDVLQRYAEAMGCDLRGWSLLTGSEEQIQEVARNYGIFRKLRANGEVDHTLLTSIIDRAGTTRVQYIGSRFDTDEFLHDLNLLVDEDRTE